MYGVCVWLVVILGGDDGDRDGGVAVVVVIMMHPKWRGAGERVRGQNGGMGKIEEQQNGERGRAIIDEGQAN